MNTHHLARKLLDGFSGRSAFDAQVIRFCEMIGTGKQGEIYAEMRKEKNLSDEQKKEIITAINQVHFIPQQMEWTNHGILKTFRFWTADQKAAYLKQASELIDSLHQITPNVCFGFGSVLGMIRDEDFIPHDDDMDLIIAFPRESGSSFSQAKSQIKSVLEASGFSVHGDNLSHYGVNRGTGTATDVFIGFVEDDDSVSWFPSKRGIHRSKDIFPPSTLRLFGIECAIPAKPELYLEKTYGQDWRHPTPNWNHPWDRTEYQDLIE